jgi:circadian clock protein KaiC
VRLEAEEAELRVRLKSLEIELEAKEIEKALLVDTTGEHLDQISREKAVLGEMRGADQPSKRKRGRANVKD